MNKEITSGIVRIARPGGPEVLSYETIGLPAPGPEEILIRQQAIGVNFADIFYRNGTFPMPDYPAPIGLEAAGVVEATGEAVTKFNVGDRIAYYGPQGAYAAKRLLPADAVFKLPDDVSFEQAAALMVKGLTVRMLLQRSHAVKADETVLVHAMTGGVGTLLSARTRHLGATVIGTVGSAAKKQLALAQGYVQVIDLSTENLAGQVNAFTDGQGVDVVYDGTGRDTFAASLELIRPGGSAVLYGWASGMPEIDPALLESRQIQFVRAVLNNDPDYTDKSGRGLSDIFELLRQGVLKVQEPLIYDLKDAAQAHADLEGRRTTGSVLLVPR